jgi:hypothetical protein
MASNERTLKFTKIDDLLLIVHAPVNPDPHEWHALMKEGRAHGHLYRRALVLSSNAMLHAKQRSELADFINGRDLKVAVLADSPVARGVVTALGWITGKYRAFPLDGVEAAVAYLGGNLDVARIRDEIGLMKTELSRQASSTT